MADTPIITDDFSDPGSGWGVGTVSKGSLAYRDGRFAVDFTDAGSLWSNRGLAGRSPVLRVEGDLGLGILGGEGSGGFLCGERDDSTTGDDAVGGVVTTSGQWVLLELVDGRTIEIDRGDLPSPALSDAYGVTVECGGTDAGALRLRLQVNGTEVAVFERLEGLASFDRVTIFTDAEGAFDAFVDDVTVSGGDTFDGWPGAIPGAGPTPTPGSFGNLTLHIPAEFYADCDPLVPTIPEVVSQAGCAPAGGISRAEFYLSGGPASRDALFATLRDPAGNLPAVGSCADGPFAGVRVLLTPAGESRFSLACFAAAGPTGIPEVHIAWTDPKANLVTVGILEGNDYAALNDWFLRFGP